jgi:OmpA-OmpF porin, OOP family
MRYLAVCLLLFGCSRASEPTVSVSGSPVSVKPGQCATLTWSSKNASSVSIDQGVGKVDPAGSQQVCPAATTLYTVTAAGDGGSGKATTTIMVAPLAPKVVTFSEAALFEFGKAELKPEGNEKIKEYREQAQDELRSAHKVIIIGYTDNVGDPDFNVTLSKQRAEAVRDYLVALGADAGKFQVDGAGANNPVADNNTDEGRAKNRRVEVEVIGIEK